MRIDILCCRNLISSSGERTFFIQKVPGLPGIIPDKCKGSAGIFRYRSICSSLLITAACHSSDQGSVIADIQTIGHILHIQRTSVREGHLIVIIGVWIIDAFRPGDGVDIPTLCSQDAAIFCCQNTVLICYQIICADLLTLYMIDRHIGNRGKACILIGINLQIVYHHQNVRRFIKQYKTALFSVYHIPVHIGNAAVRLKRCNYVCLCQLIQYISVLIRIYGCSGSGIYRCGIDGLFSISIGINKFSVHRINGRYERIEHLLTVYCLVCTRLVYNAAIHGVL